MDTLNTAPVPRRILRCREAAAYLGLSEGWLGNLRTAGTGPVTVSLGVRAVGYEVAELDRYLERLKVAATQRRAARMATNSRPQGGRNG